MWKMNFIANANRWNPLLQYPKRIQGLPLLIRPLSAEAEAAPLQGSYSDTFLPTQPTDLVYGRLTGITKHTLRTDIITLLEGCNLILQDVKVDYNRDYLPVGMMLQFPSWHAFDQAIKEITKRGRLYRLERTDRSWWDHLRTYDGKTMFIGSYKILALLARTMWDAAFVIETICKTMCKILLQGIPRGTLPDDVERFLAGCEFDSSSIQLPNRPGLPDQMRKVLVHFPSQLQAMNAFITKNRGFILNNQVSIRILQ